MSLTQETFCKIFKQDPVHRNLLHYEQIVIDVIGYHLHVITPISCLQSLTLRLLDYLPGSPEERLQLLRRVKQQAFAYIYQAMRLR
jgi:hypothetical protein